MRDRQIQLERANHVLSVSGVNTLNAKVMDRTHYITLDAKGKGSNVDLLDSNTRKLVGLTSFDANKFNKGRHFVIDGIRVLSETTATKAEEGTWKSDFDKGLINAELIIEQDEELITLPLSDLLCKKNGEVEGGNFRSVASAPTIMPEKEFNVRLKFPVGVNVADTTNFLRVEFRGFEFFTK